LRGKLLRPEIRAECRLLARSGFEAGIAEGEVCWEPWSTTSGGSGGRGGAKRNIEAWKP